MNPITKLSLYLIALLVLSVQSATDGYTAADIARWIWWDWFKWGMSILGTVALSARMFYDQSVSRSEAARKAETESSTERSRLRPEAM